MSEAAHAPSQPTNLPQFAYPGETVANYTLNAQETAAMRKANEENLGRQPRETIGRDSRIQEGVYEGLYGGEAITVDYAADPELIDNAVVAVKKTAEKPEGGIDKGRILDDVYDHVVATMRYDQAGVDDILARQGGRDGTKISLSGYIEQGVGVCRHQALYAGVILERLIDEGTLSGRVSVERSHRASATDDTHDGHAWTRYTTAGGEVIILDPAQGVIDSLENLKGQHNKDPFNVWDYRRDNEKMQSTVQASGILSERPSVDLTPYMDANGVIDRVPF